jgi:HNH endonuclease
LEQCADLREQIDHLEIALGGRGFGRHAVNGEYLVSSTVPFQTVTPAVEERRLERQHELTKRLVRPGQGQFRADLIALYDGKCVITGCHSLDAIDAAHIHEVGNDGDDVQENGILLRADLHRLFDADLMAIDPESGAVNFAKLCVDDYSEFQGNVLSLPDGGPSLAAFQGRWVAFNKM